MEDDGAEQRSRANAGDRLVAVVGLGVAITGTVLAVPWLGVEGHFGGLAIVVGLVHLLGSLFAVGGIAAALRGRRWAWALVALGAAITVGWWSFWAD